MIVFVKPRVMKPRYAASLREHFKTRFVGCTCEHSGAEHGWGECRAKGCRCRGGWYGPQMFFARAIVVGLVLVLALWLLSRVLAE